MDAPDTQAELVALAQQVKSCTDCPLHSGRTNAVPGEGPVSADILLIGEGPGFHEDRQGRPFVGPAGHFLEELLQSIGMSRDQVYIANMVKCRPPNNRDPAPSEIQACGKYLDRQIELINPLLIVTLGRFSTSRFLPNQAISRVRGRLRTVGNRHILPIMHPAAGLRRQEMKDAIEEDFAKIPGLLDVLRIRAESPVAARQPAPAEPTPSPPLSLWDAPPASVAEPPAPAYVAEPSPDHPADTGPTDPDPHPDSDPEPEPSQPAPGQQRLF